MIPIKANEIPVISKYIHDISGISLDNTKAYLLEARLGPLLKQHNCPHFLALITLAKGSLRGTLNNQIIDAISTNETLFFRDKTPFELFKQKILPEAMDSKSPGSRIRIWSAASSTGQELYSIAITARQLLGQHGASTNISLLGTDISNQALSQASYGMYNKFEIERGLDSNILNTFFDKKDKNWQIKDEIRAMVHFKKFNLMEPLTSLGKFDIIFCRNVAIYFSLADRKKLFAKIENALNSNGVLFLGSTESLTGINNNFTAHRHLGSTFYKKKLT